MAAGNWTVYTAAALELGEGGFDFATDTLVCVLVTNSYVPAPNTDATWANVSAYEQATGGGYTAGGEVLSGVTWTQSGAVNELTATSPSWAAFTDTDRYAVIVQRAGASLASTDKLLAYCDLGGGTTITGGGGTLTITIGASGIIQETHNP